MWASHFRCVNLLSRNQQKETRVRNRIGLCAGIILFALVPALAQSGGEVRDARMVHRAASTNSEASDHILLDLFVVDAARHPHKTAIELNDSMTDNWLAGGVERQVVLLNGYVHAFQELRDSL